MDTPFPHGARHCLGPQWGWLVCRAAGVRLLSLGASDVATVKTLVEKHVLIGTSSKRPVPQLLGQLAHSATSQSQGTGAIDGGKKAQTGGDTAKG